MSRLLRALAMVAPGAAVARARALSVIDAQSRYAGAQGGRRASSWVGGGSSANGEIARALPQLRARSHEMVRDHWAFRRIVNVTVGHAIGTGIEVVADTGNDRDDRAFRDAWEEWAERADITGETDFAGVTALAVRSMLTSGSSVFRMITPRRRGEDDRRVPLALKLFEGEHIDHARDGVLDGRRVRLGIALGEWDEREGIYLHTAHPGEAAPMQARMTSEFHARDQVCHLYQEERPGQVLGVPVFAPILLSARDYADLMDAVIVKAKIEACYAGFVHSDGEASPLAELTGTESGERVTEFAPGMIAHLRPGEQISFGQPTSSTTFEPIALATLYAMAAGAGITFDQLTGDLRQANYSSLRAGKIEFRRMIEQLQWLTIVPKIHAPIVRRFVVRAQDAGVLRRRADGWRWKYVMPANEPIDPRKDMEADILAVRAGRMSPQEFIAGWGRDWREVVSDFSTFLAEVDRAGLMFDIDPRKTNQSGSIQSTGGDGSGGSAAGDPAAAD